MDTRSAHGLRGARRRALQARNANPVDRHRIPASANVGSALLVRHRGNPPPVLRKPFDSGTPQGRRPGERTAAALARRDTIARGLLPADPAVINVIHHNSANEVLSMTDSRNSGRYLA